MLVLSRKENESILIGDDIVIIVTRIQGNRVRFAIEAPGDIRIHRGELRPQPNVEVEQTLEKPTLAQASDECDCVSLLAS